MTYPGIPDHPEPSTTKEAEKLSLTEVIDALDNLSSDSDANLIQVISEQGVNVSEFKLIFPKVQTAMAAQSGFTTMPFDTPIKDAMPNIASLSRDSLLVGLILGIEAGKLLAKREANDTDDEDE